MLKVFTPLLLVFLIASYLPEAVAEEEGPPVDFDCYTCEEGDGIIEGCGCLSPLDACECDSGPYGAGSICGIKWRRQPNP
ncbi:MAG: hypothetical protein ACO3XO_10385, partial [Bdellovibrionota bacterium]